MKYKAVIFDLDGTLVNSIEDIADSMNSVLSRYNFPVHDTDKYYQFVGSGLRQLVIDSLPSDKRNDVIINDCLDKLTELYQKNITRKTKPYKGINDMLDRLVEMDVKISVLSNKADHLTKKVIKTIFDNYPFEVVMGPSSDDQRKPNPAGALFISNKINVIPSEIVYVGDTGIDMQTAKNANMYGVGVLWGFRKLSELIDARADIVINSPIELVDIVLGLKN